MAGTPFRFNFANRGSEDGSSTVEDTGADGEVSGSGSPTGSTQEPTDRSTGGESRTSADQGRPVADAPIAPKRRGRQPYPRTEDGRIIRPDGTIGPKSYAKTDKGEQAGLAVGFRPNNREALRQNIQGIHQAVSQFLMVPDFMLSDAEATQMTDATANLFDRMEWNITGSNDGSGNPYILGFIFAITVFRIEQPRVLMLARMRNARNVTPTAPSTATEAAARSTGQGGGIDYSADLAAQVNSNTNAGNGQYVFN